ncbi:MAG: hypothetical protein ACREJL_02930, partial [Candidatus Methylomirabilales bacterium]
MSDRRIRLSRWSRVLYALLVIGATVILLHGRPPLTDKSLSWVETVLLLPGLIFYLPLMLLSGGIHWSVLPLRSQVPLWGSSMYAATWESRRPFGRCVCGGETEERTPGTRNACKAYFSS